VQLHLTILPAAQRRLWAELSSIPNDFVLYGGTAIALQLGHRQSVDFDFFARCAFDPQRLMASTTCLVGCEPLQLETNTLTARVDRGGAVLLSFFGVPALPVLRPAHVISDPGVRIADLLELGGMKAMLVQKRAEAKDYLDIQALLLLAKVSLADMLAAASILYGHAFTPEITLKSLCYYEDGDLPRLPHAVRSDLQRAVRACDPTRLPTL
jgi:hypothetical protein